EDVLEVLIEQISSPGEELEPGPQPIGDPRFGEPVRVERHGRGRKNVEIRVRSLAHVSDGSAVDESTDGAIGCDRAAVLRAPHLAHLAELACIGLRRMEESVIGADPEAIRNRPAELRLYPRTVADPRAVDRARQESDRIKGVNDLIVQLLSIRGEGGVECAFAVTEGSLEATGAFRRQRRIADETAGEEAEQVEEGRRRNPLAERAGNRKAASEVNQYRRAHGGRVPEAAKDVAPDGHVGNDGSKLRPPLAGDRIVRPAPVLVARATELGVAGVERLGLVLQRDDSAVGDRAGREAILQLRFTVPARAAGSVDLLGAEEIAVGRAKQRRRDRAAEARLIASEAR